MPDGTAIAMRTTDRNGLIAPIEVPVPDRSLSLTPETGELPYTAVNLYARKRGYEQIEVEDLQVFAGTVTDQELDGYSLYTPADHRPFGSSQFRRAKRHRPLHRLRQKCSLQRNISDVG